MINIDVSQRLADRASAHNDLCCDDTVAGLDTNADISTHPIGGNSTLLSFNRKS
jgi:hypothetical protein